MKLTEKQRETLKRNNEEANSVTREAAQQALYLLMEEKDYEDIRITEIINRSGISRSAFYRNYKTKDDVLRDHIGDMHDLLISAMGTDAVQNWKNYISIIRKNKDKLELLVKAHREWFLLDSYNEMLDYSTGKDFVKAFPHGYIYNMVIYWIKSGMKGSDDEVAELILEACRHNGEIIMSGMIPQEELDTTKKFLK